MFTSDQINQQISGYSYGFGPQGYAQWRADSGFMGYTPFGPGAGDAFASGVMGGTTSVVNATQTIGMAAAAANFVGTKMGVAVPSVVSNARYMAGFGMGFTPAMGIMAGVQALNTMNTGAQDQFRINEIVSNQLGNRINLGGRGTLGASRSGMQQVGDLTREMAAMPELMSSVSELSAIMDRMGQSGMITGVKSIADFKNKFRQGINSLRDMSKLLGSTMDEALTVATELQNMGIAGNADKLRAVMNRQATSMVGIGMAPEVVMQGMANGAQLAGAMGNKSRVAGAAGAAKTMQTLSTAMQMGLIEEQTVADLTGLTGERGVAALSSMTQEKVTGMFMHSGLGQAMTAAVGEVKDGKYTGKLDKDAVERMRTGQLSKDEIIRMAEEKLSAKGGASSFSRVKSGMSFRAAQEVGLEGVLSQIQKMSEDAAQGDEDIVAIVAKNFLGGDQTLADTLIKVASSMRDVDSKNKAEARRAIEATLGQAEYKKNYTLGGKFEQFKHGIYHAIGSPLERAGAQIALSAGETGDDIANVMIRGFNSSIENVQFSDTDRIRASRLIGTGGAQIQGLSAADTSVLKRDVRKTLSPKNRELLDSLAGRLDIYALSAKLNSAGTQSEKEQVLKDEIFRATRVDVDALNGEGSRIVQNTNVAAQQALRRDNVTGEQAMSAIIEGLGQGPGFAIGDLKITPGLKGLGEELTPEKEKDLIDQLVDRNFYSDYTGTFNDEKLMPYLQEHSKGSDIFLEALSTGKIAGIAVNEFALYSSDKQMGMLKSLGLDETAAKELIANISSEDFRSARKNTDDVGTAEKLRKSRTAGAAKLMQSDLATMAGSLLLTDPKAAAAIEQFSRGESSELFSLLEGTGKLGNERLVGARAALTSVNAVGKSFKAGGSQAEFIKKLGLTAESVGDILDNNDVLSEREKSELLGIARESGVMNQLSSRTASGGFGAKTSQLVKEQSALMMVQANADFVRAVGVAVPALKKVTEAKLKALEPE